MKTNCIYLFIVTSLIATNLVWASVVDFHPHSEIENRVVQFVKSNIQENENIEVEIKLRALDSRLKLTQCSMPVEVYMPHNSRVNSRFSVGVRCQSGKPWKIYIPVTVAKYAQVYVSTAPLSKGDVLQAEDLRLLRTDISKLRTRPITDANQLIGMLVKRSIPTGSAFTSRHLTHRSVINKGDLVDIVATMSGLNIRMTGNAMSSGGKGQRIRVKNSSSKKTVEGIIIDSNTVQIKL